jgi:hypothetical protein
VLENLLPDPTPIHDLILGHSEVIPVINQGSCHEYDKGVAAAYM